MFFRYPSKLKETQLKESKYEAMKNLRLLRLLFATILIATFWLAHVNAAERPTVFNVRESGAIGDGINLDTIPIQKAIDACNEAGGGVVRFPAGKFVTGTIHLKSNVTLSFDHGAELLGSQDVKDYPLGNLRPSREGNSECLLYAQDATNIRLEGLGIIDGRGKPEFFPKRAGPDGKDNRPRLLRFENCTKVTFSGLTYKNPAFWGIHIVDCKDVHFTGVKIRMRGNHTNNDALDIDACEDVLIENCDIISGDDGICLKSTLGPCRKIVVRDCIVSSATAALKFGTSSFGGFIDIDVSNCYFYDCPMGAIKLQAVDGGRLENISISRIVMEEVGSPLFIRLGNRGRTYTKNTKTGSNQGAKVKPEGAQVGSIKNVHIKDVVATVTFGDREKAATDHGDNRGVVKSPGITDREKAKAGPIMITGIPGHYVEDIVLENFKISYPGQGTKTESNRAVPEEIARYPEQFFFGVLPSWGAYIRHAKNVQFKNVTMTTRDADERDKFVLDDVEGFTNE